MLPETTGAIISHLRHRASRPRGSLKPDREHVRPAKQKFQSVLSRHRYFS